MALTLASPITRCEANSLAFCSDTNTRISDSKAIFFVKQKYKAGSPLEWVQGCISKLEGYAENLLLGLDICL